MFTATTAPEFTFSASIFKRHVVKLVIWCVDIIKMHVKAGRSATCLCDVRVRPFISWPLYATKCAAEVIILVNAHVHTQPSQKLRGEPSVKTRSMNVKIEARYVCRVYN